MVRPSKLSPDITKLIGENVALGLTQALAAESAGITYQIFNSWMTKGKNSTSGRYFEFYKHIQQRNAEGALRLLERLNAAAKAGDIRICMWILERRFPENYGRRLYRKMNVVSENKNANVEIIVNDVDKLRKEILAKLAQDKGKI